MSGVEDLKQKAKVHERYRKRDEECSHMSEFDVEREIECGICMERNPKIALPDCNHVMCLSCYRDWWAPLPWLKVFVYTLWPILLFLAFMLRSSIWRLFRSTELYEWEWFSSLSIDFTVWWRHMDINIKDINIDFVVYISLRRLPFPVMVITTVFCRRGRSQSCPYCRDSLRRVNSCDLWIFTDSADIEDVDKITRDNLQRLFMYIDNLPLLISESVFALYDAYETHLKWGPTTELNSTQINSQWPDHCNWSNITNLIRHMYYSFTPFHPTRIFLCRPCFYLCRSSSSDVESLRNPIWSVYTDGLLTSQTVMPENQNDVFNHMLESHSINEYNLASFRPSSFFHFACSFHLTYVIHLLLVSNFFFFLFLLLCRIEIPHRFLILNTKCKNNCFVKVKKQV